MKKKVMMVVVVLVMAAVASAKVEVAGLVDAGTSKVEGRVGYVLNEDWTVGLLATWFAEDSPVEWGGGAYAKLVVNPEASIPLKEWLPGIGEWLQLPETITAKTYLIGKAEALPMEGGVDLSGAVGAGAQAGPLLIEWLYRAVESGDSESPELSSGAELSIGMVLEF